jgi:hypothetical protein
MLRGHVEVLAQSNAWGRSCPARSSGRAPPSPLPHVRARSATCYLPFRSLMLGPGKPRDVSAGILERNEVAARRQRNRIPQTVASSRAKPSRCCLIFLVGAAGDNLQRVIRDGRCRAFASSHGARIQTSRSSSVVKITGIAWGCIGSTTAFGAVVKNP